MGREAAWAGEGWVIVTTVGGTGWGRIGWDMSDRPGMVAFIG